MGKFLGIDFLQWYIIGINLLFIVAAIRLIHSALLQEGRTTPFTPAKLPAPIISYLCASVIPIMMAFMMSKWWVPFVAAGAIVISRFLILGPIIFFLCHVLKREQTMYVIYGACRLVAFCAIICSFILLLNM